MNSSLQLNEVSATDTLPQTMVSHSSSKHNEHTSVVNITKVDTNSILRQSLQIGTEPITSDDESRLRIEKILPKVISNNSVPISNISQSSLLHNEHTSAVNINEVNTNNILIQSLDKRTEKVFSNSSVSITMESSDNKNKQVSAINSTEVINASCILQPPLINTEPASILSNASTNNSILNTSQSNLIKILPKTFTDGSISITMKSNIHQNKQLSENHSIEKINSADNLKTTSTDNFISNSIESTFEDPILKSLVNNNSVSITTRESSFKQSKSISTIKSTNKFKSPHVPIQISNIKPELTTDIPTSSTNNCMDSSQVNFDRGHSNKLSNKAPYTHSSINQCRSLPVINSDVATVNDNSFDIPQSAKKIKMEPIDNNEPPINSTNDIGNPDTQIEIIKNSDNLVNASILQNMSKTIILPNIYWRCLYHRKRNNTVFIERNELMQTVKNVSFNNSLVPIIFINDKHYEYNEAINTKIQLENLLVKIDNIQICLGYDGYVHDQCNGYLEDNSNESEVCCRCQGLVDKECFSKFDKLITDKMNTIKRIEKNVSTFVLNSILQFLYKI